MNVCVIPARGGSQRIPRKNIRLFAGRPMILWSSATALVSGCFDRVIVSTDDSDIARIAQEAGAEVPFLRPAALADAHTATVPVIQHAITALDERPEAVCCLYATAPLALPEDLCRGKEVLAAEANTDYAFAATTFPFPIQRAFYLGDEGEVILFQPEHISTRSQDLPEAYHDAGQFYWGRTDAWLSARPIFGAHSRPVLIPRFRVQDIDTEEDWVRAEWLFSQLHPPLSGEAR
jgi:N-acylneuraminate cytidylyltransferase